MKLLSGKSYLLVCMLGSIAQTSFAAEIVTTIPEHPEAYQPFVIRVTSDWTSSISVAVDMVIDSDQIDIRYLREYAGILSPAEPLGVSVSGLPSGEYDIAVQEIQNNEVGFGQVTIAEAPPSIPVYSMYLAYSILHYFHTADEAERDEVLDTGFGYIVDDGFNAWPAEGPAPVAAKPVCSFSSNSFGYHIYESHFYTADEEECNFLQSFDSGWEYEGIAFQALVPVDGSCPAGTTPVWRLYNNEGDRNNSNHRYVASEETYRALIANKRLWVDPPEDGWIGEGVAFCSPPVNEE